MKQFYEVYKDLPKLSALLREIHPDITSYFKDNYVIEFLGLPEQHSENERQRGLIVQMKNFILEYNRKIVIPKKVHLVRITKILGSSEECVVSSNLKNNEVMRQCANWLRCDAERNWHIGKLFKLEKLLCL